MTQALFEYSLEQEILNRRLLSHFRSPDTGHPGPPALHRALSPSRKPHRPSTALHHPARRPPSPRAVSMRPAARAGGPG